MTRSTRKTQESRPAQAEVTQSGDAPAAEQGPGSGRDPSLRKLDGVLAARRKEAEDHSLEIEEKQAEIRRLETEIREKADSFDGLLLKEEKLLRTLELYAATNSGLIKDLPRSLEAVHEKMAAVEAQLQAIDEDLRDILQKHQHGSDVMQKIRS